MMNAVLLHTVTEIMLLKNHIIFVAITVIQFTIYTNLYATPCAYHIPVQSLIAKVQWNLSSEPII